MGLSDRKCSVCSRQHKSHLLQCLTDSDYAAAIQKRSRTNYTCFHENNLISWRSRLQSVVSLSTCEAELYAMVDGSTEMEMLRKLNFELQSRRLFENHICLDKWNLWSDNQAAIKAVREPGSKIKVTKHIDVRHRWINDQVGKEVLDVCYVRTDNNVADMFTKPLPYNQFKQLLISFNCTVENRSSGEM